jgi:hypothetical protein
MQDGEEVACVRVAARAEHAHQALGRRPRPSREFLEADRRVDLVVQDRLADIHIARERRIYTLR